MSLETIQNDIMAEAEKKAKEIRNQAKAESKRLLDEAEKEAAIRVSNANSEADAKAEMIRSEGKAESDMAANLLIVEAKNYAIEKALESINKHVAAKLSKNENMKRLLNSAIKQFSKAGIEKFVVSANKNVLPKKNAMYETIIDAKGNIAVISTPDGNIKLTVNPEDLAAKNSDFSRKLAENMLFGMLKQEKNKEKKANAKKTNADKKTIRQKSMTLSKKSKR